MPRGHRRSRLFDDRSPYLDRFGLLLLVAGASVIVQALVDTGTTASDPTSAVAGLLVSLLVGATMSLSMRAAGVARRWSRVADIVVALGVAASGLVLGLSAVDDVVVSSATGREAAIAWTVLSALAPVLVVRRLLRHKRATRGTLLGAVSAYLLLALTFTYLFQTVETVQQTPFFGTEEPTTSFMYFSLVTITTLGYGDLSAATELGRLVSVMEALIGQVYLVTFVGLVVGLLVNQRGQGAGPGPHPDRDPEPARDIAPPGGRRGVGG